MWMDLVIVQYGTLLMYVYLNIYLNKYLLVMEKLCFRQPAVWLLSTLTEKYFSSVRTEEHVTQAKFRPCSSEYFIAVGHFNCLLTTEWASVCVVQILLKTVMLSICVWKWTWTWKGQLKLCVCAAAGCCMWSRGSEGPVWSWRKGRRYWPAGRGSWRNTALILQAKSPLDPFEQSLRYFPVVHISVYI